MTASALTRGARFAVAAKSLMRHASRTLDATFATRCLTIVSTAQLFKKNWAELVSEEAANVPDQEPLSEMQRAYRTLSDEAQESVVTVHYDGHPVAPGIVAAPFVPEPTVFWVRSRLVAAAHGDIHLTPRPLATIRLHPPPGEGTR